MSFYSDIVNKQDLY